MPVAPLKGIPDTQPAASLEGNPRWEAIQCVLQTPSFARSARLSAFLEYVGRRAILGLHDEITEQQIGIHVFEREPDYNPGDDGIVRQNARQLRQRLALYYQEEGLRDSIRVTIPRGSYVPVFESTTQEGPAEASIQDWEISSHAPEANPETQQTAPEAGLLEHIDAAIAPRPRRKWLIAAAVLMLLGISGSVAYVRYEQSVTNLDLLWSSLFQPRRTTYIVPGDAGMKLFTNVAHRTVSVAEYASRSYLATPPGQSSPDSSPASDSMAQRRYTTMSDVKLIVALMRLPRHYSDQIQVIFAREFSPNDLKTGNGILIGAPEANPWVQIFDSQVDFSVAYGRNYTILNRKPKHNESQTYSTFDSGDTRYSYGIVSLTPNLDQTGHVLLIEGPTMDQIEAAEDFLLNPVKMVAVLKQARGTNGELHSFDALLQTTSYKGGSLEAKLASLHLHP
ncbi:hypothetical protein [Paracidobacterium acidisoli]|uniref:hypothetical protein n=1 Tax=Paracidobacterium acidisoli TaxID=2303751 RepID=UPI000E3E55FC|nr:hypothetical protein [Paracidobacterium acidisoli]MBT9333130.1 hypothetical protein [Paracidobacterium acidisoli]